LKMIRFLVSIFFFLCYFTVVLPVGILVRVFGDPLQIRKRPAEWQKHTKNQFDSVAWAGKKKL